MAFDNLKRLVVDAIVVVVVVAERFRLLKKGPSACAAYFIIIIMNERCVHSCMACINLPTRHTICGWSTNDVGDNKEKREWRKETKNNNNSTQSSEREYLIKIGAELAATETKQNVTLLLANAITSIRHICSTKSHCFDRIIRWTIGCWFSILVMVLFCVIYHTGTDRIGQSNSSICTRATLAAAAVWRLSIWVDIELRRWRC